MPTYLTPGVYVEEVPSATKPIEGVGTSIAAFVGLAPGGPVNTPMRISNWTQFAKIYGDPSEPDNGPFMEGAYLAHSVYGFFQNGGSLCWVVRVGAGSGGARPRAALPRRPTRRVEAFRAEALAGRRRTTGHGRDHRGARQRATRTADADLQARRHAGARARGVRGPDAQEGPQEPRHEGQRRLEVHQDHDETGGLPEARAPADRHVHALAAGPEPRRSSRRTSRATSPSAAGMGGLAAVDEVTMVCMPDLMTLAANGDDVAAPRPPGQDDRPLRERRRPHGDPRRAAGPAPAGDPRVADEHRRLRLEVRHALLPVDRGHGPADQPADDGAAVGPRGRRLVPHRRHPRRPQGARRTRSSWAPTGWASRSPRRSRAASTRSASTASARSPAAASASGARARSRATRSGATSTSAGSSTTSPSRSWRARSGPCSSPTTSGCGCSCGSRRRTS